MVEQDEISDVDKKVEVNPNFSFNKVTELIRNIKQGEEIVISGISGTYPNAENVHELRENLFNKVRMPIMLRWKNYANPGIPQRTGFISNVEKYDAGYFGVHARQADTMDAMERILHEKAIEAILDAGLHPSDLENTNTGVYIGCCQFEPSRIVSTENMRPASYLWTGITKSMLSRRLSHSLKLKGPSIVLDTGCSSSLYGVEHAFRALALGEIENAIVAGVNLCLNPFTSVQFGPLLSPDGTCKTFDKTGDGYGRAEAIAVIVLQKLKNTKRSYAQVIHAKTNCDGFTEQGLFYPSGQTHAALFTEFYKECNIEPNNVSYLEAHGTGTPVGDPEECSAIDAVFTKNRKLPLLIGSVKSNIGHTEPVSGIAGITKCILGFETGFIAPNINYNTPRESIKGIVEGRMKVVVDKMAFEDTRGLAAVSSFGFGGANSHTLLHWNTKEKINGGLPKDDLPRLVCVSGRTVEAVTILLDELRDNEFDAEHIYLLYNIFRKNLQNHTYRGYTIVSKSGEITRSLRYFSGDIKPLYFIFGELNNWKEIGNNLMVLPVFADRIQRIQKLLLDKDIDLPNMLLNNTVDSDTAHILGSVAVQIGIIDILNLLEIKPIDCIGFSIGVLSAAYFDRSLSLEETINCACIINECLNLMPSKSKDDCIIQAINPVNGNHVVNGDTLSNGNDSRKNLQNHTYRGYTIVSKSGEITRSLRYFSGDIKPLYFIFGELNNWKEIGNNLMVLPVFADRIQRIQKLLLDKDIDLPNMLLNNTVDSDTAHILGSVAVQIGIIDILNLLEIKPIDCIGFSIGVLSAAYFDRSLSLEETINCACIINECLNLMPSKSKDDCIIQAINPVNGNHVVNGDTLSNGNDSRLDNLRKILKSHNSNNIKTHLLEGLTMILGNGRLYKPYKSQKNELRSADYLMNALTNNVFHNSERIDLHSVIFKISNGRTHEDVEGIKVISFATATRNNHFVGLLESVGSLSEYGYDIQIEKLYPTIDLPVSRGTRMISPYIKWNHKRDWFIPNHLKLHQDTSSRTYTLHITDRTWSFLTGHVVDGRNLFPATGYLYLVWETFAAIHELSVTLTRVTFEDCKFIRATSIPITSYLKFTVIIQKGTGKFEVIESDSLIVTGRISYLLNELEDITPYQPAGLSCTVAFPLKEKDIYKELQLRGYKYTGEFRAIRECDNSVTRASIKWNNNWIAFMDNMVQMKVLQFDTRLLYVPTCIPKLTIDPIKHMEFIKDKYGSEDKTPYLQVFNDHSTRIVSCGHIKIWGSPDISITRRKDPRSPVLEAYKFVPNVANLDIQVSIRVIMQIIKENTLAYKIKIVELIEEMKMENGSILIPIILPILDQLQMQPSVKILSKVPLDVDIEVENRPLNKEIDCSLVIGTNILGRPEIMKDAIKALKEKGFIISRESQDFDISTTNQFNIEVITVHKTATDSLVLFQKRSPLRKSVTFQISSSNDFSWVPKLKEIIEKRSNEDIIIYSENEPNSGILGLVNCLRREPSGSNVRCIFIMDNDKKFVQNEPQFAKQLQKKLAVNVFKNGQWGTYRHVLLKKLDDVESEHCYANIMARGDLSSLRMIEGPLQHNKIVTPEDKLVYVYYAALNFKDVVTAFGKIDADFMGQDRKEQEFALDVEFSGRDDFMGQDRREQECVLGVEFSGRDENGNCIMGMVNGGALSTMVLADPYLTFKVPDTWSLEEAATVPVVYLTVIYALHMRGQLKQGESILIHSGTGGLGLAAIRVALHHGCIVFTTVGTPAKRDFLKKAFPHLHDDHIGNSYDESFEQMILKGTNGRGVDMVLSSLSEDKLFASVRCLAREGRFIKIGKLDLASSNELNLSLLKKSATFHGVMLQTLLIESPQKKMMLSKFMSEGILSGAVEPLNRTIFKMYEVEQAFRFMTTGRHMGKVLIEIRNPEEDMVSLPSSQKFHCIPKYWCDPDMVYIIAGGLGGFGLELADWLFLRGATKLVLTSRNGITTGYQNYRIRAWQSWGTIVNISKSDISTKSGCQELIKESQKLGPIDAIFNLAVILNDAIFENQTPESFSTTFASKASAAQYLDELTRKLCPNLRHFVMFSSVSCGRGNAGQTNYGMANSVMERICENRKRDGYPALAIQWGAVGEVGLAAEMQEHTKSPIAGVLPQRISNCLKVLDGFLKQNNEAIVSSMVPAENQKRTGATNNIVDAVLNVLGIDINAVSVHSTLAEVGMDSITAVEIKQILERDFDVALTSKEMRHMTLARLKDIQTEREANDQSYQEVVTNNYPEFDLNTIFRLIAPESESRLLYKRLESNIEESALAPKLILFPGMEGFATMCEPLAAQLNAHTVCVQYTYDYSTTDGTTIAYIANSLLPVVEIHITKKEPFKFIAYSYGVLIALEVISLLESKGYTGTILCLDGSPSLLKGILKILKSNDLQAAIVYQIISIITSKNEMSNYEEKISNCKTWNERLDLLAEINKQFSPMFSESYQRLVANGIYKRVKDVINYTPSYEKLKSKVKLYKAERVTVRGLPDDYELSDFFENPVEVQTFEGDHITLLNNGLLAETINAFIDEENVENYEYKLPY